VTAGAAGVLAGVTALVSTARIAVRPASAPDPARPGVRSAKPRSPVLPPHLPRVADPDRPNSRTQIETKIPSQIPMQIPTNVARLCRAVEEATVSRAGVSAAFAAGITTPLCRRLRPDERMYPSAMYYFIVREAALGHDSVTASANLALGQTNGGLQRLRDLPAGE